MEYEKESRLFRAELFYCYSNSHELNRDEWHNKKIRRGKSNVINIMHGKHTRESKTSMVGKRIEQSICRNQLHLVDNSIPFLMFMPWTGRKMFIVSTLLLDQAEKNRNVKNIINISAQCFVIFLFYGLTIVQQRVISFLTHSQLPASFRLIHMNDCLCETCCQIPLRYRKEWKFTFASLKNLNVFFFFCEKSNKKSFRVETARHKMYSAVYLFTFRFFSLHISLMRKKVEVISMKINCCFDGDRKKRF